MSEGVIIKGISGFYYVHDGETTWECKARGLFRNKNEKPLVGDRVTFDVVSDETKTGNVTSIFPRKSEMIRPAVSNVDQILIVFSAVTPDPNFEMLNRYIVSVHDAEIPIAFVVTKTDLTTKEHLQEIQEQWKSLEIPFHFISSKMNEGMAELKEALSGKISVLAGPSGVGKSSLVNALLGGQHMEVGELSRKISRGKNTTRHAELFSLNHDSYILDTPGFTAVDFDFVNPENLPLYFDEFVPYTVHCKFTSCRHMTEPGCAVKEAVNKGIIAKSRYESYTSMLTYLQNLRRYF